MNKKLTKLLTVFLLAGSVGMGAVGATGCHKHNYDEDHWVATADGSQHGHKAACHDTYKDVEDHVDADNNGKCDKCGEDMPGYTPPGATVSGVTITAQGSATSVKKGETLQLYATVTGTNNPEQTVTWESLTTDKATVDANGLVTGVAAGQATIKATSTADTTKSNTITITVTDTTGGQETATAIIPEYKGPAAGPTSETKNLTYALDADEFAATALTEAYSDGLFSVPSATVVRATQANDSFTNSFQNPTVTITAPQAGKLKFYFSNGSSSTTTQCVLTGSGVSETWASTKTTKELVVKEKDVEAGTYTFEKSGSGTINLYKIEFIIAGVEATPIESIELVTAGTSDYLITQKVDCTGVQLVAKDSNGITYPIGLENCEFDVSDYNPNASGEYEIGVTYRLDSNLDSDKTEFTTSYKVKVYAVESIKLDLIGLNGSTQVTAQQAYLTTDTYAKDNNVSVIATCEYNGSKITYKLKKDWYSLTDSVDLSVAGTKKVTVSVDNTYTVGNATVETTYDIISAAKKNVEENNTVTVTVGKTGEFASLTQAVQYLKKCGYEAGVHKIIEIEEGTYKEKVWIDVPNVALIGKGEKADDTVITYSLVEGDLDSLNGTVWGLSCATVHVAAAGFKAYNVAIRNDFDYINNHNNYSGSQAAQGVALTLDGDGAVIYKCHLYGNQDTLYMKSGRSYYEDTQIDGNIDFIFGGETGLAFFEQCTITAINNTTADKGTNVGHVTAAQHKEATKPDYGYIFSNCTLTDDGHVGADAMSLGRPWGPCATVAYINCNFSAAYSTHAYGSGRGRWESMSGANPEDADFCEFNSDGDGAIDTAVKGGTILDDASDYTKANIFGTSNGKQSYTTVFDCDTALDTLKILAGIKQGDIQQDPTKVYDLLGYTGGQLEGSTGEYEGILIDATNGKFNNRTPSDNDVQINVGTVLKVPVADRYKVYLTNNKDAAVAAGDTYSVDYATIDTQLYCVITFKSQFYARTLIVDSSVEMQKVTVYDADTAGTVVGTLYVEDGASVTAKQIDALVKANAGYSGKELDKIYTDSAKSTEYASGEITADTPLYITVKDEVVVTELPLIEEATTFNFGKGSGDIVEYVNGDKIVSGLHIVGTTSSNNDWTKVAANTTITLKVKAGLSVKFRVYSLTAFEVSGVASTEITSDNSTSGYEYWIVAAQSTDVEITLTCTSQSYIGLIEVLAGD